MTSQDPSRHRWFQFSLRTMLILVTVAPAAMGWVGWKFQQAQREQEAVAWIEEHGGSVNFVVPPLETPTWKEWVDARFGINVREVALIDTQVSDVSPLAKLKNLKRLFLDNTAVSDLSPLAEFKRLDQLWLPGTQVRDLSPLAECKNLIWIDLTGTPVSEQYVQTLKQALPNCDIKRKRFAGTAYLGQFLTGS